MPDSYDKYPKFKVKLRSRLHGAAILAATLAFFFSTNFVLAGNLDPNQLFGPKAIPRSSDVQQYLDELQRRAPALRRERNAFISQKLKELGFSCNPIAQRVQLECVKFGCVDRNLIQWFVGENPGTHEDFVLSATVTNYAGLKSCYKVYEVVPEQMKFLKRGQQQ